MSKAKKRQASSGCCTMAPLPMLRILSAASSNHARGASQSPYMGFTNFISLPWPGGRPSSSSPSLGNFTHMILLELGSKLRPCKKAVGMSLVKRVIPIIVATLMMKFLEMRVKVGDAVERFPRWASGSRKACTTSRAFALGAPFSCFFQVRMKRALRTLSAGALSASSKSQTWFWKKLSNSFFLASMNDRRSSRLMFRSESGALLLGLASL